MFDVAIVGAGGMATTHAGGYGRMPHARVVGVMDIREAAAQKLADLHKAQAYTDFDRMLSDLHPDVVDVCVPTPFHADYVCRAAQTKPRGIVVEKPMARTLADCERMIAACEAADVPLFVAHVLRFFPEFATARAQVEAGAVGQPATVRTRRGGPFPRGWENWFARLDWSGGAILDLVIHDFDWLRWTFGEVERVFAKGLAKNADSDAYVETDYALVTLRFKSGAVGHVEATWADPGGFRVAFEIAGDAGLLDYNFNQPTSPPFISARAQAGENRAAVAVPENPSAINPYQAELAHFLDCLESGATPCITPQDGREAVRISLAALQSIATGQPVILDSREEARGTIPRSGETAREE